MPPLNAAEVVVVAAALVIFWVIPTAMSLIGARRRPPLVAAGSPKELPATGIGAGSTFETLADQAVPTPSEATSSTISSTIAEPDLAGGEAETAQSADVQEAAGQASAVEVPEQPVHCFQLDDLRRVRALEVPAAGVAGDRLREQEWEEGLRLAETHARVIGSTVLAASFRPQARSFHGVRTAGGRRELRFLLFADLWPTAADQAAAEAIFEIGEAGVAGARVMRRTSE